MFGRLDSIPVEAFVYPPRPGRTVSRPGLPGAVDNDAEETTLDLWTWALRPTFDDYIARLVAAFELEHPGVRVRWTDVAADAMRRKVFAAGAAGKMPDVVNFSDQHFAQFAGLDALRPHRRPTCRAIRHTATSPVL